MTKGKLTNQKKTGKSPSVATLEPATFGRPPQYSQPKEIMDLALQYLEQCVKDRWIPSKAGLLRVLNISRETYRNYKKKKGFLDTIRLIESAIEEAWVQRLAGQAATGAIFYLKNAFKEEYQDRVETDLTTKGEKISALAAIQIETKKILEGDKPKEK